MATLRDLGLQAFDTASAGVRRAPSPDRWVVLVGADGKPASALPPGTTLEDGAPLPAVIVALADLSQGMAYSFPAFAEAADVAALPWISRSCGYTEGGTTCSTTMTFPARPAVMPSCGNLLGLAAHQFIW